MNKEERKKERERKRRDFEEYNRTKDPELREKLIEDNLYIAEILAKKYYGRGIDYDDIYQVASIGLIYAVDRYDPSKGFEFSSFATPTIVGEIKKYFRDKGWTIRVPRRIQELSKKINNARVYLAQNLQKAPTVKDIAEYLNTTEEEVLEAIEASRVYQPQSLDISYENQSDDKEVNLADIIGQDEEYFEKIEMNDLMESLFKNLNEVEKTILVERYFNRKTQVAIAEQLNISQMTVSRIEKKVLERLKKESVAGKFIDDYNEVSFISNEAVEVKKNKYKYLSIVPVSKEVCLTLKGTEYEVENLKFNRFTTIAVSNEVKDEVAKIEIDGEGFLILSRD